MLLIFPVMASIMHIYTIFDHLPRSQLTEKTYIQTTPSIMYIYSPIMSLLLERYYLGIGT